jgi:two-component system, chemotaxis family, chemotaxis protein CheY
MSGESAHVMGKYPTACLKPAEEPRTVAAVPPPANALVVDDEPHVRAFLKLLLKELGIPARWEAADGETALKIVAEHSPELVLLDVNMPVMDGLQVLARIKEINPEVPVIIVTSRSAITTVNDAVRLGASGYLLKHSPKEQALETLRDALGMSDDKEESGESA